MGLGDKNSLKMYKDHQVFLATLSWFVGTGLIWTFSTPYTKPIVYADLQNIFASVKLLSIYSV